MGKQSSNSAGDQGNRDTLWTWLTSVTDKDATTAQFLKAVAIILALGLAVWPMVILFSGWLKGGLPSWLKGGP